MEEALVFSEPIKYDEDTTGIAPKWKYSKKLQVASLNVRGIRKITKREQVATYMKNIRLIHYAYKKQRYRALA